EVGITGLRHERKSYASGRPRPGQPGTSSTAAGTTASPASAQLSPSPCAASPTASGPRPPASPAALLSVTATELRPGRLPYSRAWSTGYQAAVAALSPASAASLGTTPGTSRNPG